MKISTVLHPVQIPDTVIAVFRTSCRVLGVLAVAIFVATTTGLSQTREDCLGCHADNTLSMERQGVQVSLFVNDSILARSPHAKLVCVACHTGFDKDNIPHKEKIEPVNCLGCHRDAPPKHVFHPQLLFTNGMSTEPDRSCKGCHGRHDVVSPKVPGSKFSLIGSVQSCGACHTGIKNEFLQSAHGRAAQAGVAQAPRCLNCHRNPISNRNKSQASAELKLSQARMCLACHLDDPATRKTMPQGAGFISPWFEGNHGTILTRGNALAASCADCHGSHTVNRSTDPLSPVSRLNSPTTCGRCHVDIANQYKQSIHGRLMFAGRTDTPVCFDCHAEHPNVARARQTTGPAYAATPALSCGGCHPPAKVVIKVAVSPAFFTAENPGYHGFAMQKDSLVVTRCASCHGAHDIRPKSDSASAVNIANIPNTCGACHPEAATRFAGVRIHTAADLRKAAPTTLTWLKPLYIVLIVFFVGWRLVVNLLDGIRRSKRRRGLAGASGGRTYLRMTWSERVQHWIVLIAFILLAKTGLAIHYPTSLYVSQAVAFLPFLASVFVPLHHVASGLLILAIGLHLVNIIFTRRGRDFVADMLPRGRDFSDALRQWKYSFGLAKEPPAFHRFAYFEKWTYWFTALGLLILTVTGLIMAFVGKSDPHMTEIAKTIHFYQTWLTTLSLIAGHLYFVVFNPDIYPWNRAMWNGNLTEDEMKLLHPLELEERES